MAGALPEAEARKVARMASLHPEIAAEIEAIEAALIATAEAGAPLPSERALAGALERIGAPDEPAAAPPRPLWQRAWPVAASILLAASLALNTYLFSRWQRADARLADMRQENEALASERESLRTRSESLQGIAELLASPGSRTIALEGQPGKAPGGKAYVYWNEGEQRLFVRAGSLPRPPEGFQYQLWAIRGEQRIDAGVFDYSAEIQPAKASPGPVDAFAVTLEKAGGSPVPDLGNIYAVGAAGA